MLNPYIWYETRKFQNYLKKSFKNIHLWSGLDTRVDGVNISWYYLKAYYLSDTIDSEGYDAAMPWGHHHRVKKGGLHSPKCGCLSYRVFGLESGITVADAVHRSGSRAGLCFERQPMVVLCTRNTVIIEIFISN